MRRWIFLVFMLYAGLAQAHKPSDSYLSLSLGSEQLDLRWDIALRDLEFAIGLDENGNGQITWGELHARQAAITQYAATHLTLVSANQPCQLRPVSLEVDRHSDGAYAVLHFIAQCESIAQAVRVDYSLFFDLDAQHRGLWRAAIGDRNQTGLFDTDHRSDDVALSGAPNRLDTFIRYGHEGVWHIWTGFDHVLFLLSLLLPSVLCRQQGRWQGVTSLPPAFVDVVKVVTAFTLAHSITLTLGVLHVLVLPSHIVESAIALSVALAAMNNVYPLVKEGRWLVAFSFGLLHGMGFASVLIDLGLPTSERLLALAAFNLGVEAGQLAIVGVFLPLAFALRNTRFYSVGLVGGGSLAIAVLAVRWFFQRGFLGYQ